MRYTILLGVTALAIGAPMGWWLLHSAGTGPARATVDRVEHNWGNVRPGSHVTTAFVLSNKGGRPLKLGEPTTTCGCTKPVLSASSVPPGGRADLSVGFDVPRDAGPVGHSVKIPTDDPEQPTLELRLFAHSWLGVQAIPQSVDLGQHRAGVEIERTIQLVSPDRKPFHIGHVSSDMEAVRATVETPGVALPAHRVTVVYHAGERLGLQQGILRVTTDRDDAPILEVPIVGDLSGPVQISPSSLSIRPAEIGSTVRRTLVVGSTSADQDLSINSVSVSEPWTLVKHESHPLGRGRLLLEVSLKFPEGDGSLGGELRVKTAGAEPHAIQVPLTIFGWTPPAPSEERPRVAAGDSSP